MKKGKLKFATSKEHNMYRNITPKITEQLTDKEGDLFFEFADYFKHTIANIVKEVGKLASDKLDEVEEKNKKEIEHLKSEYYKLKEQFFKLLYEYAEPYFTKESLKLSNFTNIGFKFGRLNIEDHDSIFYKDFRQISISQKVTIVFGSGSEWSKNYDKIPQFIVDKSFHVDGILTFKYDTFGIGQLKPLYEFEFDYTISADKLKEDLEEDLGAYRLLKKSEYRKPVLDKDSIEDISAELMSYYIGTIEKNPEYSEEKPKEKSTDKKPKVVRKTKKKAPKTKGNPLTITLDYREEDTFINFNAKEYKKHINRFLTLGKGDYRFIPIKFKKEIYMGLSPYSFGTDSYKQLSTLRVSPIVLGKVGNKEEYTDTINGVFSTERQLKAEKESIKNILKGKPYKNINFSLKQINNYNHLKIGNTSILIPPYPNGENQELGLGKNYEELWDRKGYGMVCSRIQNVHLFELFFPKNSIEEQGMRDIDRAIGLQHVDGMGMSLFQTDGNYATIISCEYENKEYPTQQQEYIKKYFDTFITDKNPQRPTQYTNNISFPIDMLIESVKDGGDIYIPISDHRMSLSAKDGGDISPFYSSFYKGFVFGYDEISMPLVGRIVENMKGDKLSYILTKKYIEEAFELAYTYCLQNGYTTAQSWTHTTSNKKFTQKKENHAYMFFTDDGQCGFKFTDYGIRTNQILNDYATTIKKEEFLKNLTLWLRANIKNIPFGVKKDEIYVTLDSDGFSVYLSGSGSKNELKHKKNLFKPYYFQRILAVMDKLPKPEITAIAGFGNATDPMFVSCFGLDKDITIVMQTRINV